jgi:hypothetical protein
VTLWYVSGVHHASFWVHIDLGSSFNITPRPLAEILVPRQHTEMTNYASQNFRASTLVTFASYSTNNGSRVQVSFSQTKIQSTSSVNCLSSFPVCCNSLKNCGKFCLNSIPKVVSTLVTCNQLQETGITISNIYILDQRDDGLSCRNMLSNIYYVRRGFTTSY